MLRGGGELPTRIGHLVIRSVVTGVLDGRVHQEPQRPADRRFTNGVDVPEPAPQQSGEFFGFDGGHRQAVQNRREPRSVSVVDLCVGDVCGGCDVVEAAVKAAVRRCAENERCRRTHCLLPTHPISAAETGSNLLVLLARHVEHEFRWHGIFGGTVEFECDEGGPLGEEEDGDRLGSVG
jgi:hypothetical protein